MSSVSFLYLTPPDPQRGNLMITLPERVPLPSDAYSEGELLSMTYYYHGLIRVYVSEQRTHILTPALDAPLYLDALVVLLGIELNDLVIEYFETSKIAGHPYKDNMTIRITQSAYDHLKKEIATGR